MILAKISVILLDVVCLLIVRNQWRMSKRIDELENKINELENKINELENKINELESWL